MSQVVVDTDIVSFLFKGDTRADDYAPLLHGRALSVSFMTVAELELWALLRGWGEQRRQGFQHYLSHFGVVPSSPALCRTWASVRAECRWRGRPIEVADAWIAATALLYNVPLITGNRADYEAIPGLTLLSA